MKTPDINGKTPEEIKKGMTCCLTRWEGDYLASCHTDCPYRNEGIWCRNVLMADIKEWNKRLESSLAQAERERDAAVVDITNSAPCFACWHFIRNSGACKGGKRCCDEQFRAEIGATEYDGPEWKWRGVCAENTKEE